MESINNFIYLQLRFISNFGESLLFMVPLALLLSAFLLKIKKINEGLLVLVSLLSYPYSVILKHLFQIHRPDTASYTDLINKFSFPSSHVVVYTVFFGYLLYITLRNPGIDKFVRFFIVLFSIYFISLVGVSRVVLGEHWVSDAIGGYLFGAVYLVILIYLDIRLHKSMTKNQK
ncbi:phosphatase PAP2 family protein [candidate division WWE3 bacterium]|jgi:undecaprenyl-diphosphatase|uniref:Phosphatase PAP2 family protein n=1 Tax=candidate division WWE3 bacterium TaxID=2053526 RepID=A0A3A4ZI21_UNCKA|nr:MAG: phosphatase PAP2 family protein [candidate division WWE3 bacterium]